MVDFKKMMEMHNSGSTPYIIKYETRYLHDVLVLESDSDTYICKWSCKKSNAIRFDSQAHAEDFAKWLGSRPIKTMPFIVG